MSHAVTAARRLRRSSLLPGPRLPLRLGQSSEVEWADDGGPQRLRRCIRSFRFERRLSVKIFRTPLAMRRPCRHLAHEPAGQQDAKINPPFGPLHRGKQVEHHRPRLDSTRKPQVRAPLQQAQELPRTPRAKSSEGCRPGRLRTKHQVRHSFSARPRRRTGLGASNERHDRVLAKRGVPRPPTLPL